MANKLFPPNIVGPAVPTGRRREDQVQDVYEEMPGYIGATPWAKPYFSNHHHENPQVNTAMLGHVNCGYLSTPGRPPTLEGLKQHAQSLAFLISTLAPSTRPGLVDTENTRMKTIDPQTFARDQAYDWLNNLRIPYDNIDKAHRRPLNSLANLVKKNSDEKGVEFHCPMTQTPIQLIEQSQDREAQTFPFQTHMTLLMHANECLERLDHEYSAMGGLLSILPTDRDNVVEHPDLEKAKQTLIGQWLLYTQHLTGRMHELEIAYGNALDVLAGEAMVPAQHLSSHGPDGRSGREIVFPQDRWLLANAGEDVYEFIHRMLDRKEVWVDMQDNVFKEQHVVGDQLRKGQEEEDGVRGVVHVDLQTRFYRLKNSGRGTIFVLPAYADRPNTEHTRELENRPTVVTLPTPSYPDRSTAWDRKNLNFEHENLSKTIRLGDQDKQINALQSTNETQRQELERLRVLNRAYEEAQGAEAVGLAQRAAAAETARNEARAEFEKCAIERTELRRELDVYRAARQQEQRPPAQEGVTLSQDGATYSMNKDTYEQFQSRSAAVEVAKKGIDKVKGTVAYLAKQGRLNVDEFIWMDTVYSSI
ncbi:hypothetical protein GGR52DRAFT_454203 [Hypoxylon sp. FL1284]|nr:hypothetical protein GGR52DRAFT_454203 [Hypoxylon sp. FL1284]